TGDLLTSISRWLNTTDPTGCYAMTTGRCVTSSISYNANGDGDIVSITEPAIGDNRTRTTNISYDDTYHAWPKTITDAKQHTTTRLYNGDGTIASFTDENSKVIQFSYDVYGRKSQVARPDGGTTTYTYTNWGSPTGMNPEYNQIVTTLDSTRSITRKE